MMNEFINEKWCYMATADGLKSEASEPYWNSDAHSWETHASHTDVTSSQN